MEQQINWLILTVVLNALFTGVIVSYFNKRLEAKFAKQMFEDQLKFKMIHEKRVETLENLYKKFVIFTDSVNNIIIEQADLVKKGTDFRVREKDESGVKELEEFWNYFKVNRLFLSEKLSDRVWEVYSKAEVVHAIASSILWMPDKKMLAPYIWLESLEKLLDLKSLDSETVTPEWLLNELSLELDRQAKSLEKLYKSVSDTSSLGE